MFTIESSVCDLLENSAVREFLNKNAPDIEKEPGFDFLKKMSLKRVLELIPEANRPLFHAILEIANGNEIMYKESKKEECPQISQSDGHTYDIDDVDGPIYILARQFSGCFTASFTKPMDEAVYGKVSYKGIELPKGTLMRLTAYGNIQLLGIPVRDILTEYDTIYELLIEDFKAVDGTTMKPQIITIKTLPKKMPDATYLENDAIALEVAREGIVLLKNLENTLPLKADAKITISRENYFRITAVGAGRINPRHVANLKCAIKENSKFEITDEAEIGIFIISRATGENLDNCAVKGEFYLSDEEEKLLNEYCNTYKKVVVILNSGYPIDVRWATNDKISAVLWCGFPGMLGAQAIVEILYGRINPSGKLPDTWSLDYMDIPASANFFQPDDPQKPLGADATEYIDTYYEEDIYVGYRYFSTFEKEVAYPFGFGLSYSDFKMAGHYENGKAQIEVSNTGATSGKEVVQIYAKIPEVKLEQPLLRLVGFAKTKLLEPSEQEILTIQIEESQLKSFDEETASWIMEAGIYEFFLGTSTQEIVPIGNFELQNTKVIRQVENLMKLPVEISVLSKKNPDFPKGLHSGIKEDATALAPVGNRRTYMEGLRPEKDFVDELSVAELARLSVCASHGWGMDQLGEAGRVASLERFDIPEFVVADGNSGVNVKRPNIGMPASNTLCATWNVELSYSVGRVIADEAKDNGIHLILAPGMNIHRNPLNGRHPEYFSEDPYLAGVIAGHQSKGMEEHGVSSCIKHVVANNCESSRKRNHSIMTERALREIYLRVFEVALTVHQPDSLMTAYNAVNGCFTATDEELLQGIFYGEFGFEGFVMTDWNSYDTVDVASAIASGNGWMTPGSTDDTFVKPIIQGVKDGIIDIERLRQNVRLMLRVVQKRSGVIWGDKISL